MRNKLLIIVNDDFEWMGVEAAQQTPRSDSLDTYEYTYITYDPKKDLDLEAIGQDLLEFEGLAVFSDGAHVKKIAKTLQKAKLTIPNTVISNEDFMGGSGLLKSAELFAYTVQNYPKQTNPLVMHRHACWDESDLLEDPNERLGITNLLPRSSAKPVISLNIYGQDLRVKTQNGGPQTSIEKHQPIHGR